MSRRRAALAMLLALTLTLISSTARPAIAAKPAPVTRQLAGRRSRTAATKTGTPSTSRPHPPAGRRGPKPMTSGPRSDAVLQLSGSRRASPSRRPRNLLARLANPESGSPRMTQRHEL